MPAQRLTMRRVRELLRLHYGVGASARAIARELGVSRSTVKEYLARAVAGQHGPKSQFLCSIEAPFLRLSMLVDFMCLWFCNGSR